MPETRPPPHALRPHRAKLPWRTRVGLFISLWGVLAMGAMVWEGLSRHPEVRDALLGGALAALATAAGASLVLFARQPSAKMQDSLFGFGAGVMLAATAFSLILPGIDSARAQAVFGGSHLGASALVGIAILLGGAVLLAMDRLLPHEHFIKGREGAEAKQLQRTWLFVIAICLHNLPEGLAIGMDHVQAGQLRASALSIGIAIQDIPEGFIVAAALLAVGYSRGFAVGLGVLSGLVEPLGAVLGATVVANFPVLLPWGLGMAAGAMLFVISHEIIPESHRKGHESFATAGLMLGFVLMLVLDTMLK